MSEDEEFIEFLKKSREQIGELEPVIMTEDGRIIDGRHRLAAYPGWRKVIVKKSPKEALKERIHRTLKARVTRKERQAQILEYALYLEEEGVKPEEMVSALAKELPFSEQYLRSLLPAKYKKTQMARQRKKLRNSVSQFDESVFAHESSSEKLDIDQRHKGAVKPKPKPVKTLTCPRCHVEIRTVYCTKCFSELDVREIARIIKREMTEDEG